MNSQIINTVLLRQVLGVVAVAVTVVFTSSCGSNFTAKETESNNQERELALLKERSDQEKNKNDSFSIVHANICSFISNRFDDYYNTYGKSAPNTPAEAVERLKIISETIDKAQTKLDNAVATYSPLNGHNTKIEGDLRLRIESASASIKQSIADYSKFTEMHRLWICLQPRLIRTL
jgi:hypothetical protein